MCKKVLVMCFLLELSFVSVVFAADNHGASISGPRVGILDIQKLIAKTNYVNKAVEKLRNKYAAQGKALRNEQRILERNIKKYNEDSSNMRFGELLKLQHKIANQQDELRKNMTDLQQKVTVAHKAEIQELIRRFSQVVDKIALRDNLEIVLFKDVVLCGFTSQDITDEVISSVRKKAKT